MANLEQAEHEPKHAKMSTDVSALNKQIPNGHAGACGGNIDTLPTLIPSFAEACKLVSAPYSCLVMDTHKRHIALSPMYLKKKRTGIQEELNTELLRYSESLKGVPLAYDEVCVLGQHGDIYDDSGYIHLDIQANFVVFQPRKGQKLLGVVNKLSMNHAGCLVHGCFNASIPKPAHVTVETWRDAGPRIGAELEFEVCQLDADTVGVILIRGRLRRTRVQELMAAVEISDPSDPAETLEEPYPEVEPSQDLPDASGKVKKKKKKKDKHCVEEAAIPPTDHEVGTVNGIVEDSSTNGHIKKKKKEKRQKEDELECTSSGVVQGSDSSGYLSDKQSRKRKHGDKITSSCQDDPETPKIKKKKL
ncbi:DNA-directed RNA polymerase I subunit RPA43 [Esox lucius]|uniref:DNA-directed RNA polymerase subunit n=1 Tax=Esox lucius TaxID=8010 RepID=A0A3P8XEY3_ESOLU|nr:DNA-directed RNA polymerase I subunit RPA43 [Esox lucius]